MKSKFPEKPGPEKPGPEKPGRVSRDGDKGAAVVDLRRSNLIGHGWKRLCYIHPNDPTRCIKVGFKGRVRGWGWRDRLTTLRFDRGSGMILNRREWKAFRRVGAVLVDYVPRYHGPIATTLGVGLEIDLVRDASGGPSKQLRRWLQTASAEESAKLRAQFDALFDLLQRHEIWLFDLNMNNFVIQETEDGAARIWLIDIKRATDSKEILQITSWTRGQKRRKLTRRIKRFHNKFETGRNAAPPGN